MAGFPVADGLDLRPGFHGPGRYSLVADRDEGGAVVTEDHTVELAGGRAKFLDELAAGIPQVHRLIVAGSGEELAVGAEGNGGDFFLMAFQDAALPAGGRVPEPHRLVAAAGRQLLAVGAECDC